MYIIKISKDKFDHITEAAEQMLRYGGKIMQCLEGLKEEEGFGERDGYGQRGYGMRDDMNYRYPVEDEMGMRGGYGMRHAGYGMREDFGEREDYGERRGRNSMGRFTRI